MEKEIIHIDRPNGERLVGALSTFKGTTYVSIRSYYHDDHTEEYKPGRNGINVPLAEWESFATVMSTMLDEVPQEVAAL